MPRVVRSVCAIMSAMLGCDNGTAFRTLAGRYHDCCHVYDGIYTWQLHVNGRMHSLHDLPARIGNNGLLLAWYKHGKRHRDGDLPAVILTTGMCTCMWFKNGKVHRSGDLPAVTSQNGTAEWWKHGKRHRDGDLPAVIDVGSRDWYKHGKRHRDGDLPAIIWSDGAQEWYKNDMRYRDGNQPAVINADGEWEWYQDGECVRVEHHPSVAAAGQINTPSAQSTMGVDWYPCGACEDTVCDAGDFKTCEFCDAYFHVHCWKEVGKELCCLCPCECSGAYNANVDTYTPQGHSVDYEGYDDDGKPVRKGCKGCDCTSHECSTMPCCSKCFKRITKGPSKKALKMEMVRDLSPKKLAAKLGIHLETVRATCDKRIKRPKFMPYPVRVCDGCSAELTYDKIGRVCESCTEYFCTACWPKERPQHCSTKRARPSDDDDDSAEEKEETAVADKPKD